MIIATIANDSGAKEIHSKHDVRSRDSVKEELSKTRIEALETLLADLEWRMDLCMHQVSHRLSVHHIAFSSRLHHTNLDLSTKLN